MLAWADLQFHARLAFVQKNNHAYDKMRSRENGFMMSSLSKIETKVNCVSRRGPFQKSWNPGLSATSMYPITLD